MFAAGCRQVGARVRVAHAIAPLRLLVRILEHFLLLQLVQAASLIDHSVECTAVDHAIDADLIGSGARAT